MNYKGFLIQQSTGHGKARKGAKQSATIQVLKMHPSGGGMLVKQVRFSLVDKDKQPLVSSLVIAAKAKSMAKAKDWVDALLARESTNEMFDV